MFSTRHVLLLEGTWFGICETRRIIHFRVSNRYERHITPVCCMMYMYILLTSYYYYYHDHYCYYQYNYCMYYTDMNYVT